MVWLDLQDDYGQTLYFDIRRVVRQRHNGRWQSAFSGICGNGVFELPVRVEPAGGGRVHLPQPATGDGEAGRLLAAVDRVALEESLLAAARQHAAASGPRHPWHDGRGSGVAEPEVVWRQLH